MSGVREVRQDSPTVNPQGDFAAAKAAVLRLIRDRGHERRERAFQLSSGAWSHDYIDGKRAISDGESLTLVCRAIITLARERGAEFDAVGGLTMGADELAHGVAMLAGSTWFSVRKDRKPHGKQQLIEGGNLQAGTRVLLVDDVVTTGSSILKAFDAVAAVGAHATFAVSIVDRGTAAGQALSTRGIRYEALVTYQDLGIPPVAGG
jgi:orotate phosphoribosyltransferase